MRTRLPHRHRPKFQRPLPRRRVAAHGRTTGGPCCSHACSRPCPWSARTAVPTGASSPSLPKRSRCGGYSATSASPASRPASPQPAGHPPGTTHRSISDRTGRPWRNRHRSRSSPRKCSGSRLPSPPPASDAPLPAPRPRQTTPHADSAPSEMATSPPSLPVIRYRLPDSRQRHAKSADRRCYGPRGLVQKGKLQ